MNERSFIINNFVHSNCALLFNVEVVLDYRIFMEDNNSNQQHHDSKRKDYR